MILYHDSRNPVYRYPMGAVPCGRALRLRLRSDEIRKCWVRTWWDGSETRLPMENTHSDIYECNLTLPGTPGLFWYYFIVVDRVGNTRFLGNAEDGLGGEGRVSTEAPEGFQVTVYDPAYDTPEWMRNGMMMQIMVDRFRAGREKDVRRLPPASYYHVHWDDNPALIINDEKYGDNCNNDYFGGDLRGVIEKLDYIRSLGVTAIYLNPIFQARSNHKYNTGNYRMIDPGFGTEEDFRELCEAAAARGMRVILDGVFSHTGSDSIYFNRDGHYGPGGAYNDLNSPYAEWYRFRRWPDDYECWWDFRTLPNVDEENASYQNYIIHDDDSVTAHWLRAGAAGWRLDVADELPMSFIRAIRARVKRERPDGALVGEVWEDPSNKISYGQLRSYVLGDTLDSTMNYPLRRAVLDFMTGVIDAAGIARRIESQRENLPLPFFYSEMNLLGSHDTPRVISMLADLGDLEPERAKRRPMALTDAQYDLGRRRFIAAWTLVCALPGMPCLYYGDEAGLTGMADPYCRGTYPWGREDMGLVEACRRVMQERMHTPALRTGDLHLTAVGEDVLIVERRIREGADVFGRPAADAACALAVNRAAEPRRVEYGGRVREIPGEFAMRLDRG